MSVRVRALLFLAGAIAFLVMVLQAGPRTIAASVVAAGWTLAAVIALYGVVQLCYAAAWQTVMGAEPVYPPFLRTFAVTVSTLALNFITPFLQAGGEPFRIASAAAWLGRRRAAGSVMLYTMLHALSSLLLWLSALGVALFVFPRRPLVMGTIAFLMLAVIVLGAAVFSGHHGGVLGRVLGLVARLPLVRRLSPRLERHRESLEEVDRQIMAFHRRAPGRFLAALLIDFLGRVIGVGEFWLICHAIGVPVTLVQSYLIGGLLALAINASFFVPFELGSRETALYFIYHFPGLAPELGVATSVVTRVRELAWVAIGVGRVWAGGRRDAGARPGPTAAR
jgi:uncharacterized protein (TIRG00374 family)